MILTPLSPSLLTVDCTRVAELQCLFHQIGRVGLWHLSLGDCHLWQNTLPWRRHFQCAGQAGDWLSHATARGLPHGGLQTHARLSVMERCLCANVTVQIFLLRACAASFLHPLTFSMQAGRPSLRSDLRLKIFASVWRPCTATVAILMKRCAPCLPVSGQLSAQHARILPREPLK